MISPLHNLKDKIGKKRLDADSLVEVHNNFMLVYGWIPVEEYANLPIPTFFNLFRKVNEEIDRKNKMGESFGSNK